MKIGDIVKMPDGNITRCVEVGPEDRPQGPCVRVERDFNKGWEAWGCKLLTVADLFREAGFPVPEGAKLCFINHKLLPACWYAYFQADYQEHQFEVDATGGWVGPIDTKVLKDSPEPELSFLPDLSRLPAADAWDCLPGPIKAVVEHGTFCKFAPAESPLQDDKQGARRAEKI